MSQPAATIPRFLLPRLSWANTPLSTATPKRISQTSSRLCQKSQISGASRSIYTSGLRLECEATTRRHTHLALRHGATGAGILSRVAGCSVGDRRVFSATSRRERDHHFDTLKFVQRLKDEGFTEDQAVAMMKVLGDVIEESIQNLTRTMVLREDQEKATYTQKVDFAKLRSELLSADSTESSLTRATHERLTNDLAKLNSRLRDEIQRTQASVRLDLNLEKGRIREEANSQDLKIKETETRIEQESAALRERLEAVKFSTLQWLM